MSVEEVVQLKEQLDGYQLDFVAKRTQRILDIYKQIGEVVMIPEHFEIVFREAVRYALYANEQSDRMYAYDKPIVVNLADDESLDNWLNGIVTDQCRCNDEKIQQRVDEMTHSIIDAVKTGIGK